ncbi:MAG: site-specific DNA-methyltransferase [Sphingomicrobium sp.]
MQPNLTILAPLIEMRSSSDLKPDPRNSKLHPPKQLKQVMTSIEEFGWTNPILTDEAGSVLAGHLRLQAAKKLGIKQVPTIKLSHMTAAQKRAYIIADNRIAENGSWDPKLLALEHEAIQLLDPEFDLSLTGFDHDEIEVMFDNLLEPSEDAVPAADPSKPAVSRLGDLWRLGDHLVLCGDALLPEPFERLLGSERAQMVIADGPYNLRINGHVSGKGRHREFLMGSGEMTRAEFTAFLRTAFSNLIRFSCDGSIHFLFMDWRHLREMLDATDQYAELKNLVCWKKGSAGLGTFYRSQHELIFVTKNGKGHHDNNFGLGEKGRHRSNVWDYPGLSGWTAERESELAMHPTVKPVAMIADAIRDCSRKGSIILDCFGGSGTTLIAAEQTGRKARLIELDPLYVDVIIRRFEAATGGKAVLEQDGRRFDQLQENGR